MNKIFWKYLPSSVSRSAFPPSRTAQEVPLSESEIILKRLSLQMRGCTITECRTWGAAALSYGKCPHLPDEVGVRGEITRPVGPVEMDTRELLRNFR